MRERLTESSGHAFIVTDRLGDIAHDQDHGLFVADTRFLSRYAFRINGAPPVLLRSGQTSRAGAQIFATNGPLDTVPERTLGLVRERSLDKHFEDTIALTNFGDDDLALEVSLEFDADFA